MKLFRLGAALPCWMVLAAAAHPRTAQIDQKFSALARALGIQAPDAGTARGQLARIISRIEGLGLIEVLKKGQSRIIQLKGLDGKGGPYQHPIRGQVIRIEVPGTLFSNGWHIALSPAALTVTLIGLAEQSKQWGRRGAQGTWYKAAEVIASEYGLARSSFEKGKAELSSWEILTWHPTVRGGTRLGLYRLDLNVFNKPPQQTERSFRQVMAFVYDTLPSGKVRRMPVYRWKKASTEPAPTE